NTASQRKADRTDTCLSGYVWRLVNPKDHVCVTEQTRQELLRDNKLAKSRLQSFRALEFVTPSQKMKLSLPFKPKGCHHLKDGRWEDLPCASKETKPSQVRPRLFNPGLSTNGISSLPRKVIYPHRGYITYTPPFVWASVYVGFISSAVQATETGPAP